MAPTVDGVSGSLRPSTAALLGTALGDSLGLPWEGLSRDTIARRRRDPLRQQLAFGRGALSDDTEQSFLVAQCLLRHPADVAAFERSLRWGMRWWFLSIPAGIGFGTLRACLRLWMFLPRSAVRSAGNGAAMRVAALGAFFRDDAPRRRSFVEASARVTHAHPDAIAAAAVVAEAAAWAARNPGADPAAFLSNPGEIPLVDESWRRTLLQIAEHARRGAPIDAFVEAIGCPDRVSGWSRESVPLALAAWALHPLDPHAAVTAAVSCGGDTDTNAAMAGALASITAGRIPEPILERVADWPLTPRRLRACGERLEDARKGASPGPLRWPWWGRAARSPIFLAVVLAHGLRRGLPW